MTDKESAISLSVIFFYLIATSGAGSLQHPWSHRFSLPSGSRPAHGRAKPGSRIRGAVLLALPQDAVIKFFEALRYEERFYVYMGVTLALGLFLTIAVQRMMVFARSGRAMFRAALLLVDPSQLVTRHPSTHHNLARLCLFGFRQD